MADQRRNPEHRPSPEALLEAARREDGRVGKLKIFVGAAPGVGKTYEMLHPRARQKDGDDVVVGIVETHGRKETEALLEGLEVIPRRRIEYKGQGSTKWTSTPSGRDQTCACRRARSHQCGRQPAPQALSRRRRAPEQPASMSTRRSTPSTSKASTTSSSRSPTSASAKRLPIPSSTEPTRSNSSTSRPTS